MSALDAGEDPDPGEAPDPDRVPGPGPDRRGAPVADRRERVPRRADDPVEIAVDREALREAVDARAPGTRPARRLRAEGLHKACRKRQILKGVSLHVDAGDIVGLLGPNGAGKTTCFYMVVGLVRPDEGRILIDDVDITAHPMHARARLGVGYLPQEASVFRQLTVEQNIVAILELRKDLDREGRRARLESLLEELQVTHIRDSPGVALSGGERRRVEIARALAADPAFILLDEPFAGVDPISIGEIKRIVSHLKGRGIGVLITDHNVRETLAICDRAYILSDGRLIAEGNAEALLANEEVRRVYLGDDFRI